MYSNISIQQSQLPKSTIFLFASRVVVDRERAGRGRHETRGAGEKGERGGVGRVRAGEREGVVITGGFSLMQFGGAKSLKGPRR
jgi:hypothetical protein